MVVVPVQMADPAPDQGFPHVIHSYSFCLSTVLSTGPWVGTWSPVDGRGSSVRPGHRYEPRFSRRGITLGAGLVSAGPLGCRGINQNQPLLR